jgi:ssDNA-binding Zn-finger/Zn-ribbon topoisomerase 1
MIENVKCPTCDGPMTSRANASTGQRFWGCKRYPVCKGTRNTDGEARKPSYRDELEGEGEQSSPSERQRNNDRGRWRHS